MLTLYQRDKFFTPRWQNRLYWEYQINKEYVCELEVPPHIHQSLVCEVLAVEVFVTGQQIAITTTDTIHLDLDSKMHFYKIERIPVE